MPILSQNQVALTRISKATQQMEKAEEESDYKIRGGFLFQGSNEGVNIWKCLSDRCRILRPNDYSDLFCDIGGPRCNGVMDRALTCCAGGLSSIPTCGQKVVIF